MKLNELKKMKCLKTREDVDNIIKAALRTAQVGTVTRTSFDEGMYTIEFKVSPRLLQSESKELAKAMLDVSVVAASYIQVVDKLVSEIRIMCRVGSDTHITITPCDFLCRLNEVGEYKEMFVDWINVSHYQFVKGI